MTPRSSTDNGASRPPLLRLLIVVTLLTLAVALWYLTRYSLRDAGEVHWVPPATPCDLQAGPCRTDLGDGRTLTLGVGSDGPIRPLEVLPLEVRLAGLSAEAVVVEFVGREMDMGWHRFPLEASAPDVFRGAGQLSICTEAVMPWRARVMVDTPRGRLGGWFDFEVTRSTP